MRHGWGEKEIGRNWCVMMFNFQIKQGLVNVPMEHHPTIGGMISNTYLKVMFKIPKKGHLPTPVKVLISVRITHFFVATQKVETFDRFSRSGSCLMFYSVQVLQTPCGVGRHWPSRFWSTACGKPTPETAQAFHFLTVDTC